MSAPRILVIDLEATCAEDHSIPPEEMEIIEIGAVWATHEGTVLDRFQAFVRPLQRPRLTQFCIDLTGIQQAKVDAAPLFSTAAEDLRHLPNDIGSSGHCGRVGGDYDRKQVERDCRRHGIGDPLQLPHENSKRLFAKCHRIGKAVGLAKACDLVGLTVAAVGVWQSAPIVEIGQLGSPEEGQGESFAAEHIVVFARKRGVRTPGAQIVTARDATLRS